MLEFKLGCYITPDRKPNRVYHGLRVLRQRRHLVQGRFHRQGWVQNDDPTQRRLARSLGLLL